MHQFKNRPIPTDKWLAGSCHDLKELKVAECIDVDFALLSPVKLPRSHDTDLVELGWVEFQRLVDQVNFPVYALGGMVPADISQAQNCGGQGISSISAFWPFK